MKRLLNFSLLILLLASVWACNEDLAVEPPQYGSVSGHVLNKKDGQPLTKASVRLNPSGRTVQTDTTGRFRFDTVLAGKYTLQAAKEGFRDELTTVEIAGNYGTTTIIRMTNENPSPTEPVLIAPTASVSAVSTITVLKWQATDPGKDPLTYDLTITREGSTMPTHTFTGLKADSLVLKDLAYNTTYYWQVTASDGVNSVSSKTWSFRTVAFPDVSYVFVRRVEGNGHQIFAMTDGGNPIQLTRQGNNWRPVVSPNGKQIAFISDAKADHHLFVMNYDGSNLHQVTTVSVAGLKPTDLSFCWSPDGTELLYPSNDKLYVVRADGSGNGRRLISLAPLGRSFAGCDWTRYGTAPDGRIIARTTGSTVYDNRFIIMNPQGKDTAMVLNKPTWRVGNPVFSLTGDKVLFSYDKSTPPAEDGRQLNALIGLIYLTSKGPQEPAPVMEVGNDSKSAKQSGTNDLEPRFSPDGAKIIFTNVSNTGTGERTVWTSDLSEDSKENKVKGQNRVALIKDAEMPYWRSPR